MNNFNVTISPKTSTVKISSVGVQGPPGTGGGGSGDVVGPGSSGSGNIATFSGTTGKLIQDSGIAIGSFGASLIPTTTAAAVRTLLGLGSLATLSAAPAGTLTGATLASGVTASSLTSVGSLTGLTVAKGTITTSQPLSITETWNAGAVTFNSLLVNATSTASASASTLIDLQIASASKFNVNKSGDVATLKNTTDGWTLRSDGALSYYKNALGVSVRLRGDDGGGGSFAGTLELTSLGSVNWQSATRVDSGSIDLTLVRDGAGQLALRNSTNAQKVGIYNTYTSSTNNELLETGWTTNVAHLWTVKGSGGGTARPLVLGADATELLRLDASSKISFFGATTVVKQTLGGTLTNNVTSGGSSLTLADITSLTTYSTDAANIRNNIYQLGQALKSVIDGLRNYGLLT